MMVSEDAKTVNDWLREPDYAENFTFGNLIEWINRRPLSEVARLTAALSEQVLARPLSEWHEDMGAMLWWCFPIEEPPYCGSPLDLGQGAIIQVRTSSDQKEHQLPNMRVDIGGWPGYHTHFTPIPLPAPPPVSPAGESR